MGWTVQISNFAEKQIKKLDKNVQKRILDYLFDRLEDCKNPRHFGEPLKGNLSNFWRYRIGDYRVICEIHDDKLTIVAISVGHRRDVYK